MLELIWGILMFERSSCDRLYSCHVHIPLCS